MLCGGRTSGSPLAGTAAPPHRNIQSRIAATFRTAVDIYAIAPLIGVTYNLFSDEDTSSNSKDDLRIFADAIIKHQDELDLSYRIVMLTSDIDNLSNDERVVRAFKDDENAEKLSNNMKIFNGHFRGGLEWLFENITKDASSRSDYLNKIYEITEEYKTMIF